VECFLNEMNHGAMLWVIWHEWPPCAWFAFNCYRHIAVLTVQSQDGRSTAFIFSQYGVTEGDASTMAAYGMGLLPLIRRLKVEFPTVKQLWYTETPVPGERFVN
jgi:lysophospholipid acyltransferase (LPLAT)-like uncharacterized protein